jgi:hypothetical protein
LSVISNNFLKLGLPRTSYEGYPTVFEKINYLKELVYDRLLVVLIIGSSIAAIYVRAILFSIFIEKCQVPKRTVIIKIVHCVEKLDEQLAM